MTLTTLEVRLSASERVGPPDYTDNAMLQYLRAERIVPPYQTRGYKLVELVRIYELGSGRASGPEVLIRRPHLRFNVILSPTALTSSRSYAEVPPPVVRRRSG
jgi:hypothetical protein